MSDNTHLKVVLCWHMHQPDYRDALSGQYQLPWTYLHAIKDYVDMAAILEQIPNGRAVVNFVPILLEQIDDYARQVKAFLAHGELIRDPLLAALAATDHQALADEQRMQLVHACLRANEERLVKRFPSYRRLADMAALVRDDSYALQYFSEQYLSDLLVWYHLAWLGETVRRGDSRVNLLLEKEQGFSLQDRHQLVQIVGELIDSVIPRFRALAERGQIELSMTPYAHPMIPLLIDFKTAREAMPEVDLPRSLRYPGGEARSRWHIEYGMETFQRYFHVRPRGCWPAEGGVSDACVRLLGEYDFDWLATGESVLRNSLARCDIHQHGPVEEKLHTSYRIKGLSPRCFFRDDGLSDLIGFTYSSWHADDAVSNLIHHLESIAAECDTDDGERVVSIILDGENAWESYPENGFYFLTALYERLATHPELDLCTFSDCVDSTVKVDTLSGLIAGSWVYGTFSTWLGDPDKNQAWDLLCEAKQCFDEVISSGRLTAEEITLATQQLAVCEGSDWFWWFGDYNPADTVSDFDRLYRRQLACLYRLLGEAVPEVLEHVISVGGGSPEQGGVMRYGRAEGH